MSYRDRFAAEDAAKADAWRASVATRTRATMQAHLQRAIGEALAGVGLNATVAILKQELLALGEEQARLDRMAPEVDRRRQHYGQIKMF